MRLRALFATATLALGLAGLGVPADAVQVIPGTAYTGGAGAGNSGTDPWGQPWQWNATGGDGVVAAGLAAWGTPGLGAGTVDMYQGSVPATNFEIAFVNPAASINTTPSIGPGGLNDETRFDVCTASGCTEWTRHFASKNEVDFYAPGGSSLTTGEQYFINVVFNQAFGTSQTQVSGANTGFTAVFTSGPVPEPATWAMLMLGVGMIGLAARRRKEALALAA